MPLLWNVRRQCFELFQMQVNLNNYMIFCHPSCSYYQFMFCIQPICVPDVPLIVTPSVGRNIGKSIRKPANLRRLQVLFYPNHPQTIPRTPVNFYETITGQVTMVDIFLRNQKGIMDSIRSCWRLDDKDVCIFDYSFVGTC